MDEIVAVKQIQIGEKTASSQLSCMIRQYAESAIDAISIWEDIRDVGKQEDFTEEELKEMMRPVLRQKLEEMGLSKKQIRSKVWTLLNPERRALVNKNNYQNSRLKTTSEYDSLEESSNWDRDKANQSLIEELKEENEGLKEEITILQTHLNDKNEVIKSFSFEENPDIFRINQKDPNSMVFSKMKVSDAISILKRDVKDELIDIAWRKSFVIDDAKQDVRS